MEFEDNGQVYEDYYGKHHAIFDKDIFRVMKTDNIIKQSQLIPKPAGVRTLVDFQKTKYKTRSQIIMEEYEKPLLTQDQLYLIDKVVRIRGKKGRFGVDHSEILNYELEIANKGRDDHMNQLVYKQLDHEEDENMPKDVSKILFRRIAQRGAIEDSSRCSLLTGKSRGGSARTFLTNRTAPSFQQWVRNKDAQKRLQRRLIQQSKQEIRQELLEYAKFEKQSHDTRVVAMEEWLNKKRLNEAYSVVQMRDAYKQQEIDQEARRELSLGGVKSYKMWVNQKKNQQKYQELEQAMIAQMHAQQQHQEGLMQNMQHQMDAYGMEDDEEDYMIN